MFEKDEERDKKNEEQKGKRKADDNDLNKRDHKKARNKARNNEDFLDNVAKNNIEIVTYYLDGIQDDADAHVDPAADNNRALRIACEEGLVEMVRLLLTDPRVHPMQEIENPDDNDDVVDPLILACQNGHLEIVKTLLADQRVDPGLYRNQEIQNAIISGFAEIVELLLKHSRVNPRAGDLLFYAVQEGHAEVVKVLLADCRIQSKLNTAILKDQESSLKAMIGIAAQGEKLDVLEMLLSHSIKPVDSKTVINPIYPQIKAALNCNKFGLFSEVVKDKKLERGLSHFAARNWATEVKNTLRPMNK